MMKDLAIRDGLPTLMPQWLGHETMRHASLCATSTRKGWSICRNRPEMFGVVARSSDADRSSREDAIKAAQERKKVRGRDRLAPVSFPFSGNGHPKRAHS